MLGFTHYSGKSRQGRWTVQRKTAKGRFRRALKRISLWCRANRHQRVAEQRLKLNQKLRGHYNYYGVTGNMRALSLFHHQVEHLWRKWLSRRSRKAHLNWEKFQRLLRHHPLTPPRVVHSVYRRTATP